MSVPPSGPPSEVPRPPGSDLDPMPRSRPAPPVSDVPPGPGPDEVPERPGGGDRVVVLGTGRDDGRRHLVDVPAGEGVDPEGLRARCGATLAGILPGRGPGATAADCPRCLASEALPGLGTGPG